MTTEQRLERLERKVRWMRRIGAVAVAVAAALGSGYEQRARERSSSDHLLQRRH